MERWLTRPAARWTVPLIGVALCSPAIGRYLALDDFVLFLIARGEPRIEGLSQGSFDLFTFTTGRPADNKALIEHGLMLPWFTDPELRVAFFRPLSSLTHRVDLLLWPATPPLMYLHSLLWFGAALAAAGWLYRRLETGAAVAGWAALLYAFDHVHGPAVAWLSNRNALLATCFGVLALVAHDAGRRGNRAASVLGPVCLGAGVLSGEFAIGAAAYLFAYALVLDRRGWRSGLVSLWPYLLVIALWQVGYKLRDFGVHGSGTYVDPLRDPGRFLGSLPGRISVLLSAEVGLLPSDTLTMGPPPLFPLLLALAVLTLAVAAFVLLPLVRSERVARFWALGMVTAAVPVAASFPSDRVLFFVGLGGMALLARVVRAALDVSSPLASRPLRALAFGFALLHLVLSPALLPGRALQMQLFGAVLTPATEILDRVPALEQKTVVIVSAPLEIFATYVQAERAFERRPRPPHLYPLSSAATELKLTRSGPNELTLEPGQGFLYTPLEQHYRSRVGSLPAGTVIELSELRAEVLATTADGRPARVRFSFKAPLESPALVLLTWRNDRYERFAPPAPGSTVTLPAADIGRILSRPVLESR